MTLDHIQRRGHRRDLAALLATVLLCAAVLSGPPALAGPAPVGAGEAGGVRVAATPLEDAVDVDNVLAHLETFQRIADRTDGNRATGTEGYLQSATYVAWQLMEAGFDVDWQTFTVPVFNVLEPPVLAQVAPDTVDYVADEDFAIMRYSASGDVTAPVTAVDLELGPGSASTSGCEPEDFAGFTQGHIALLQRGTCTFGQKAQNAEDAGAVGAVIFNSGATEEQEVLLRGTLGEDTPVGIPVFGTTYALGVTLSEIGEALRLRMSASTETVETQSSNVLAETPGGDPDNVVMAGAHLDSVPEGPGINDNGSGSAALLEVALQMAEVDLMEPTNKVRFAWWGAEEGGLIGSSTYVAGLSEEALADIALYLNFDMVGSPNFVRFIYDGDGSAFPEIGAGPEGSAEIEAVFEDYFADRDLATAPTEFSGRSDYQAFINNGVASGGLFTGAEGIKTEEQAEVYGGTAGEQYDPCYHEDCDDIDNVDATVLDEMSDAIAHAVTTFATSAEPLSGSPGEPRVGGAGEPRVGGTGDPRVGDAANEHRGHQLIR